MRDYIIIKSEDREYDMTFIKDVIYGKAMLDEQGYADLKTLVAQKLLNIFRGHTIDFTRDCLNEAIKNIGTIKL